MDTLNRFPSKWISGEDPNEPRIQSWSYDPATTILRQSVLTHWEAPFLYLIEGQGRALLLDTGTGDVNIREAIDIALANKGTPDLIVAHTHSHTDHVGGDHFFQGRERTQTIAHDDPKRIFRAFEIENNQGHIDLGGGRILDVLFTPGHQATHLTFYDRKTELLFTGDTLYPGRLTVDDWPAYRASIDRLVRLVDERPVTNILGSHIELQSDGSELVHQTPIHANEHRLELTTDHLRDLHATLTQMGPNPTERRAGNSFVVVPR